jgi:glycosyltransferase involved in cell wall biosynthesis
VEAYDHELRTAKPERRPPRLAFVSPLPPQASGVADASYRLLESLSTRCEIDAFVDGYDVGQRVAATAPQGVKLVSAISFDRCERARGGYDGVVYCLGNSEFHPGALALLRKRPGIVIAHDLRLSGLYAWAARERPDAVPRSFYETLHRMYGNRIPAEVGEHGWLDLDDADRYGIFMARDVLEQCDLFLVHSVYAAQLARFDARPADVAKIRVIPFGIPPPVARPNTPASREPLVATFGIASAAKQTEKIIEAFATVAERDASARFAVVGSFPDPRERERAEKLVGALGLARTCELTGRLGTEDYSQWMARATVAVQLRAWSNGETSAAVMDCLAAGVPTVVTRLGSAAELPEECVVKVERDVTPRVLGETLAELLADTEARKRLATAAQDYARANSFGRAADAVYELVLRGRSAP